MCLRSALPVVGVILAVLSPACVGDGASDPTANATGNEAASTTATAAATGEAADAAFRRLSRSMNRALAEGDRGFFGDRLQTTHRVCGPADVPGYLLQRPTCPQAGYAYDGLELAVFRSDESGLAPAGWVLDLIERLSVQSVEGARDQYGGAGPVVYATGVANDPRGLHAAVLTALIERPPEIKGTGPLRAVLVTYWNGAGDQWSLTGVLYAFVAGEDLLSEQTAGSFFRGWQRFSP